MTRLPQHPLRRRTAERSALLRLFALLLAVLALCAQQRSVAAARLLPVASSRVVNERSQKIESNALRVDAPPRVARSPRLTRLPVSSAPVASSRLPRVALAGSCAVRVRRAQLVTHFHAKRRIPRMNSEEPPRALS